VKPFWIKSKEAWALDIPSRISPTGKRQRKFFSSREEAREFCGDRKDEHLEHGKQAVTSDDRAIVALLRKELGGDLSIVPEMLRHWKRTGEKLNRISVNNALAEFLGIAERDYPNHRTLNDIKERLEKFQDAFNGREVHEVTPTDIERFLEGYSAGWDRWSYHKRLGPFFKLAKRRRWIVINPMEEVPTPKTPTPEREIYTVQQFSDLLHAAELYDEYHPVLPYVVLCGFCFLRTAELVRMYEAEKVLRWEHILWSENTIHVPVGVAKSTRRESGDERFIPLSDVAKAWLDPIRKPFNPFKKPSGDVVPCSASKFGKLWRSLTDKVKVPRVDNGLRHSAISYSLAAYPDVGVAKTAQYAGNSEATIRKHYRRLLKESVGKEWFAIGASWFDKRD